MSPNEKPSGCITFPPQIFGKVTPQTAIEGFGRKLGHMEGHMGITGRESGSPDGTFPLEKVTFLMWARCGHEKIKERMKKVNGKP